MYRDFLTMFLAAAVALFALNPAADAQFAPAAPSYGAQQYPPQSQYGQQPQYSQPTPQYSGQPGAQEQGGDAPDPAVDRQHAVARVSLAQGDVNVKRGDTGQLEAAAMNAPLVTADRLQTSPGSRAEVELDYANLIRLAPNTDVGFADLEYRRATLQLGAGTVIYRVLRDSSSQVEIDTPSIGTHLTSQGEMRISVLDDGTTQVSVRAGQAEIFGPRGSEQLNAGSTVLVRGNPSDPEFQTVGQFAPDQLDEWSGARDRQLQGSQSYRYVSPDIPGAEDLDGYGNWVPSQYGQVWAPQAQSADWSPYSAGQWTWEPYYGWTWVDSAPWGWAPYHYGRWFNNGGYGWCWYPGARASSYFWSPALVGFFGLGAGVGFGIGVGLAGLGWVALAPFEIFHSWWGHGWNRGGFGGWYGNRYGGYGRNVDIARTFRNASYRGGAILAGANGFGGPNQRFTQATRVQLSNASLIRGQMPVAPSRAGYQFSNRQALANPRLAQASSRQFFQHTQSGGGQFRSSQYPSGQSSASRGFTPAGQVHGTAPNQQNFSGRGSSNFSMPSRPSTSGGWQRFGDPGNSGSLRQGFTSGAESSGWHQFGQPQRPNNGTYGGSGNFGSSYPSRSPSFSAPQPYRGGTSSYNGFTRGSYNGGSGFSAPHSSGSNAPHYSSPAPSSHGSSPHYSAPSHSSGGESHGGGSHGGGSSSHNSGGGGHHR